MAAAPNLSAYIPVNLRLVLFSSIRVYSRAFAVYFQPRTLNTTNNPAEKVAAPSNTQTGRVKIQARAIFRRVAICRPDPLAAIVPAIPMTKRGLC
jgi:hypothetical protein